MLVRRERGYLRQSEITRRCILYIFDLALLSFIHTAKMRSIAYASYQCLSILPQSCLYVNKKAMIFEKIAKKQENILILGIDFSDNVCYYIKAVSNLERWLSWSKAHDWKSCVG